MQFVEEVVMIKLVAPHHFMRKLAGPPSVPASDGRIVNVVLDVAKTMLTQWIENNKVDRLRARLVEGLLNFVDKDDRLALDRDDAFAHGDEFLSRIDSFHVRSSSDLSAISALD